MAQQLNQQQNQQQAPAAPAAAPPPIPGAAQPWFLAVNGQQTGPFPVDQLPAKVASGELTPSTLVWQQGMGAWTPAAETPGVRDLFGTTPPPLPPQA
jgi:hypothetical protein